MEGVGGAIRWLTGDAGHPHELEERKSENLNPSTEAALIPIKEIKRHQPGSKREKLHKYTARTLGSGDLWKAVALPEGESLEEWISVHTVDFFNEVSLLYGTVAEEAAAKFSLPGQGFPPGFVYMWPGGNEELMECSAPQYVDHVMSWVEDVLNDPNIFPTATDVKEYPSNFRDVCGSIFKRIFRVFAIMYCQHFEFIESLNLAPHLNTSFKHFIFFCLEFDLVEDKEFRPLEPLLLRLKQQYQNPP